MTGPIRIPGSQSTPQYIEGIRVTYKAASGIFNYYDGARQDVEAITGIIVGWGFQFDTTKGKPSKKKSASLVSSEFGFEVMSNNTPIKMRELVRENGEFSSNLVGSKSYKSWKEEGQRLTKIVYILDANDVNKLYKVQFSGLSFGEINKLLKDDMPQYLVTLKASTETKSTENGEFYMPSLEKISEAPESLYDIIVEKVNFIYGILNNTTDTGVEYEAVETTAPKLSVEEEAMAVFGADDIP